MFRKFLIWVRSERKNNFRDFNIKVLSVFIGVFIISILVDIFIPFASGWNLIRTALLIPLSTALFILGYEWSLSLHEIRVKADEDWQPYRVRYSRRMRRYISAIVAAFIFVFVYGFGYGVGYTFISSFFVSICIAIAAFIRPTRSEEIREEMEIPDARDVRYNHRVAELEAQRLAKRDAKKNKRKSRIVSKESVKDDE